MRGRLIVIDGSDASGKKTQAAMLVKRILQEGRMVETLDFPRYGSFFGKLVERYLHGEFGSWEGVRPEMASLLYALDRFAEKERISAWLAEGKVIVLDRYTESNMGYQAAKIQDPTGRKAFLRWVEQLEQEQLALPKADLVVYLHVPVEISSSLMEGREDKAYLKGSKKDIHEKDKAYQEKVVESYLSLCKEKGWHLVECTENRKMLSKEQISLKVWDVVRKSL